MPILYDISRDKLYNYIKILPKIVRYFNNMFVFQTFLLIKFFVLQNNIKGEGKEGKGKCCGIKTSMGQGGS